MTKIIFKVLRFSGLPWLFREFIQNNKVSILMFHEISKETADRTFSYLRRNYNLINLNDYIEAYKEKDGSKIPKKALIITFDDGHISNYQMLPVIKKNEIPATIFLCSSIVNTNRHFWFKHENLSIPISELKQIPNYERLKILCNDGFKQDQEYLYPHALSKSQIIEMAKFVNMQSHTKFHPCLPNCEFIEAKDEIYVSKKMLEDEFGFNINAIAYPNGDYSERDIELTKKAGYECGITVDYGFNTLESDIFRLKRVSANDTTDLNELIVKSSGLWGFLKAMMIRSNG